MYPKDIIRLLDTVTERFEVRLLFPFLVVFSLPVKTFTHKMSKLKSNKREDLE